MIKIQEILELSVSDRLLMIEQIWNSITPDDPPSSVDREIELDKRLARYEKGETTFFSWNDVSQ